MDCQLIDACVTELAGHPHRPAQHGALVPRESIRASWRARSWLLWTGLCAIFGMWALYGESAWHGATASQSQARPNQAASNSSLASLGFSSHEPLEVHYAAIQPQSARRLALRTKNIEDIQVGDRVEGDGSDASVANPIDPPQWRTVRLDMAEPDGSTLQVALLRPIDWIRENRAEPGHLVRLSAPELGAVGFARVVSVSPCPELRPGHGFIVTGTFAHEGARVLDLSIQGLAAPLGVTANHPVYSKDRAEFVPAGELRPGERLSPQWGEARVLAIATRPGRHRVFNLEVDGAHVYRVSSAGLLVHNKNIGAAGTGGVPKPKGLCFTAGTLVLRSNGMRPIEQLRVGQRVLTTDSASGPGVRAQTTIEMPSWRHITLAMPNPDGSGDIIDVELLRPLSWLCSLGATPGAEIDFALPELGVAGPAHVISVTACPLIEAGLGRVVLATMTHLNCEVLQVSLEGLHHPLELTRPHRLFSETKQAWVPAANLRSGDRLRTRAGFATVSAIRAKRGIHRVYNVEVDTEHCYYASAAQVLSHNANPYGRPRMPVTPEQQALIDMAGTDSRLPVRKPLTGRVTPDDADVYWNMAQQQGFNPSFGRGGPGGHWHPVPGKPAVPHINIGGKHVPVPDGWTPPQ
jgi:hypothetical protein